jgi:ferredoxin
VRADGPPGEAAWAKQRLSRATQALPNGYCELPLVRTCPHANSCLTCPMFVTSAEFLPQHHAQRQQTLQIITAAEANGQARLAEMNRQVSANLDRIISALEDGGEEEKEASAGAS